MDGDKTVTATFTQDQYTLRVNVVGHGSVTMDPAGGIYDDGTVVTLTPHADPGCSCGGWSGPDADDLNDNGDGTWSLTMDGDKTVTATFTQDEYTLMVNVVGDGAVSKDPDQATYHYGDEVQLTATAGVGSSFSGWSGDLGGNVNPETLTMDGDKIVTATFTPGQCPLTVNVLGHGSVTLDPAGGIYDDGTVVTLTPHADAGWSFDRWSGANAVELINNHDGTWSLIMDGPKDITAKFVHHIYMPYLTGVNYRHYHRYYLSVVLK
jgi:hypothetical protein